MRIIKGGRKWFGITMIGRVGTIGGVECLEKLKLVVFLSLVSIKS